MPENSNQARHSEGSPNAVHAAMIEALVAGEGLQRVAAIASEQAGGRVEILVPRPGSDGSGGSAAERYVAQLVAGETPEQPPEVSELVPILSQGELQGAVVFSGEGGEEAREYLRVAAVAALTGIAMLNARDETARSLGGSFLAELLTGADFRPGDIARRAAVLGCDLGDGLVGICLDPAGTKPGLPSARIAAAFPDSIVEQVGRRLYALLPVPPGTTPEAVARRLPGISPFAGISSHHQAAEARGALEEAELLLDIAGGSPAVADSVDRIFRLLLRLFSTHPDEVRRFCDDTIGPLVRHDEEFSAELLATLETYRQHNCNMNLTARATYTHRHTVSNRLTRIRELTGLDPQQSDDRALLGLALKARRVLQLRPPA
ncbi:MAG TPA: helix-turn-helix domain-containing protein [Solirubrobacterales bacterium]|nr:helix-turn-helix domain-containing protein [Solirubrobacterales bacterium]